MLYMLGGAARSGKSLVARRFLQSEHIPYFSLDFLMMGMARGLPQSGVNPDDPSTIVGERLWPVVKPMCVNIIEVGVDYLVEGDSILPSQIEELEQEHANQMRACFVGYTDVLPSEKLRQIRELPAQPNDWIRSYSDEEIMAFAEQMVEYSRNLQGECSRLGIRYYDVSNGFEDALQRVLGYLASG
jgi:hypothetical protein